MLALVDLARDPASSSLLEVSMWNISYMSSSSESSLASSSASSLASTVVALFLSSSSSSVWRSFLTVPSIVVTRGFLITKVMNLCSSNSTPYSCSVIRILSTSIFVSTLLNTPSLFVSHITTILMTSCTMRCRRLSCIWSRIASFSFTRSTSLSTFTCCSLAISLNSSSTTLALSASGSSRSITSESLSTSSSSRFASSRSLLLRLRRAGSLTILCSLKAA
mmetsp:Transcript_6468/g.14641  ORF Transcript_6468/g.14641 Transcript_6468/m.14641 type:complete len:221 (-) Transcript_6468:630-1292(-)